MGLSTRMILQRETIEYLRFGYEKHGRAIVDLANKASRKTDLNRWLLGGKAS